MSKIIWTNNKPNNAIATVKALCSFKKAKLAAVNFEWKKEENKVEEKKVIIKKTEENK